MMRDMSRALLNLLFGPPASSPATMYQDSEGAWQDWLNAAPKEELVRPIDGDTPRQPKG
jgi:hypothetical protein